MTTPQIAPYGSWKSPITSSLLVADSIGLGQVALEGDDVYWSEGRPQEGGRQVVVRRAPDGRTTDLVPQPFNARTRVHEYGGGSYAMAEGTLYFSNFADQRIYRVDRGDGTPRPITPEAELRYADAVVDKRRGRLVCVREDHTVEGKEAVNALVSVNLDGDAEGGAVLVSGNDFYSSPRLSPDGTRLAWLAWNHPNMPWDGTELWVGELAVDGSVRNKQKVAGESGESIYQPEWAPEGVLYFVSDRTGWWNLYRARAGQIEAVYTMEAEFGRPQWVFGTSTYAFESPERIICSYIQDGLWNLAGLPSHTGVGQDKYTLHRHIASARRTRSRCLHLRLACGRVRIGATRPGQWRN